MKYPTKQVARQQANIEPSSGRNRSCFHPITRLTMPLLISERPSFPASSSTGRRLLWERQLATCSQGLKERLHLENAFEAILDCQTAGNAGHEARSAEFIPTLALDGRLDGVHQLL